MSVITSAPPATPTLQRPVAETATEAPPALTARVKWFNDQKGFGFLCDDEGRDVFVHYGIIAGEGFRTLSDGEVVRYDVAEGPKGRRATRVVREE